MRNIIFSLCLLGLSLGQAFGQSYSRLWKDTQAAINDDHPKTALLSVDRIVDKATHEGQEAQLLRATLVRLQLQNDIAPDSARAMRLRLEHIADNDTAKGPAVQALWCSAVGQLCLKQWGDTAAISRGIRLLRCSLSNLEVLHKAKAADFLPLFVRGKDSRYYGDDLLSVLADPVLRCGSIAQNERRAIAARLCAFYRSKQMCEAALLLALDSIRLSPYRASMEQPLREMAAEYRDLPLNVETYIELIDRISRNRPTDASTDSTIVALAREGLALYGKMPRARQFERWLAERESPEVDLSLPRRCFLPNKIYELNIRARHARRLALRLVLLDARADDDRLSSSDEKTLKGIGGRVVTTYEKELPEAPAWAFRSDSLQVRFPQKGVYRLQLELDGQSAATEVAYVSGLFALRQESDGDTCRVWALDAVSGRPLKSARLRVVKRQNDRYVQQRVVQAGPDGDIVVAKAKNGYNLRYFLSTPDDAFLPAFSLNGSSWYREGEEAEQVCVKLFTDRAIYRPGQEVAFSGIVYTQRGDEVRVHPRFSSAFLLRDSNGQEVSRLTCHTDSFGTLSGRLRLPAVCLPGQFTIAGTEGGSISFRVEEYKRPTFTATLTVPQEAFRLGDSITVTGRAETLTGLPVARARVKYTIKSQRARGIARTAPADDVVERETVTDSLGVFRIPLALRLPKQAEDNMRHLRFALFSIQADVTAPNGETASAACHVSAGSKASWLSSDFPATICREHPARFTLTRTACNGQTLSGEAAFCITQNGREVASGRLSTGTQALPRAVIALPSGEYAISIGMTGVDTINQPFVVFSENDERPVGRQTLWQYVRTSERGDSALVVIGSPRDSVTLFVDIFAGRRRVEHSVLTFSNRLLRFPLHFKTEWGDGVRVLFAFVKDDTLHTVSTSLIRPRPDKRLNFRWRSFRSTLLPGQRETWSLQVVHPDGTPATASLMARLYDASLDAFARAPWTLALHFNRNIPSTWFSDPSVTNLRLFYQKELKAFSVPELRFTHWDDRLFSPATAAANIFYATATRSGRRMLMVSAAQQNGGVLMAKADERGVIDGVALNDMAEAAPEMAEAGSGVSSKETRTNFAETAFFFPALQTDKTGIATLTFTLPQSLTAWNFTALAHTRDLSNGRLDTTIVARKVFMVEPALPRFVRRGDRLVVPVTLRNLSAKAVSGTLTCRLSDPDNAQSVRTLKRSFTMKAGEEQVQLFESNIDTEGALLLCRITGETATFGDGEEHLLPVLSDRTEQMRSLPFSSPHSGTTNLRIDTLWSRNATNRRLTVEMTSNPTWSAVSVLSPLATGNEVSATGWATRYYALTLAARLAKENPTIARALADSAALWTSPLSRNSDLKQILLAETPWASEAKTERERAAALGQLFDASALAVYRQTATDHLKSLQDAEGAWGWYPGMRGNAYITADVALLLARLQTMTPDATTTGMLNRAVGFLKRTFDEEIVRAKREKRLLDVGTAHLNYLYVCAALGRPTDETVRLLTKRAIELAPQATMDFKALLAVVLQKTGYAKEAKTLRQSLTEHTVATPAMGRYFDTQRARFSSRAYRIPAQVATIEALQASPDSTEAAVANEMRLWLMQSKRTEMWTSSRTSADAVYALLERANDHLPVMSLNTVGRPMVFSLYRGRDLVGFNAPAEAKGLSTWGYVCDTHADGKALQADRIVVRKATEGLSWGTVTAHFTEPIAATTAAGSDLIITRSLQRWHDGRWTTVTAGTVLGVGSRVRQVVTLKATRDMDFVSVSLPHPACFEARETLSGYVWSGICGSYRAVRDASIGRFFDHLPKGTVTFTEEYNVSRAGRYECGIARAQCQYAPEFAGNTAGMSVEAR